MNQPMGISLSRLSTLLLAVAACWQAACVSARVPEHILGDYQRLHPIRYFDGEMWHDLDEQDTLQLRSAGGGELAFTLDTVANNGHTCHMDGVAVPIPDGFEYREVLDLPPDEEGERLECVLRLRVDTEQVVLEDLGHGCRLYYCGMRAKLNGLSFSRASADEANAGDA